MPSVNFYFQVHQPFRLGTCSYLNRNKRGVHNYFDADKNGQIMRKVAEKCYLPTNQLILKLIKRYNGAFRAAYSITGVAIEQMERYAPQALDSFKALADTGCVEFIGETYYHSLCSLYDEAEFRDQVQLHRELMQEVFGQSPRVFRNTELIYQDHIGLMAQQLGFKAIIAEGCDDVLGWRNPNFVYTVPNSEMRLLLKNYRLSDDIAFRFSNRAWSDWPLTADKFAKWVHDISGNGEILNLFMDYETFGEHQWESTGIFQFLEHLPEAVLRHPDWQFSTPSQVIEAYAPKADIHFHRLTSWADVNRDISAWRGNRMQHSALEKIYAVSAQMRKSGDEYALDIWRKLQTSDHFYYMCTKWFADGDVHAYFSPYESPYDAFINYMNAFKDFSEYFPEKRIARIERSVQVLSTPTAPSKRDGRLPPESVREEVRLPTAPH
ncbi:MAG: glycoside hydrolase family 57 protein [Oligoflexia bacterium]|nr:glycoside hydrolase family 57 protein [Oligoflexia bacterium]